MFQIRIKNSAKTDLKKLKKSNLKENFQMIIEQLKINLYESNQGFEKLYPPMDKKYSRRINVQHRVVYTIDDNTKTVTIYSAWSHYE